MENANNSRKNLMLDQRLLNQTKQLQWGHNITPSDINANTSEIYSENSTTSALNPKILNNVFTNTESSPINQNVQNQEKIPFDIKPVPPSSLHKLDILNNNTTKFLNSSGNINFYSRTPGSICLIIWISLIILLLIYVALHNIKKLSKMKNFNSSFQLIKFIFNFLFFISFVIFWGSFIIDYHPRVMSFQVVNYAKIIFITSGCIMTVNTAIILILLSYIIITRKKSNLLKIKLKFIPKPISEYFGTILFIIFTIVEFFIGIGLATSLITVSDNYHTEFVLFISFFFLFILNYFMFNITFRIFKNQDVNNTNIPLSTTNDHPIEVQRDINLHDSKTSL